MPLVGIAQNPYEFVSNTPRSKDTLTSYATYIYALSTPVNVNSPGIQWTENLSWEEIKEKARLENKYIFLDCYTTWCSPCKKMDAEVYPDEQVGDLFNRKFISVRVQMDRTERDNEFVQCWYKDALAIHEKYYLEGYPSFLFFSPDGKIVHKELGAKKADSFIAVANKALDSGKVYDEPLEEYKQLKIAYQRKEIYYDRLPFMITMAKKKRDTIYNQLVELYESYVCGLDRKKRYTKENIAFWATMDLSLNSPIMHFIYKDSYRIDRVMNKQGYAAGQVDKCIQSFIVTPFLVEQMKILNPDAMTGVTTMNASTGRVIYKTPCYAEADWKELNKLLSEVCNDYFVKRNIVKAKARWYDGNSNWAAFALNRFKEFKNYSPDFTNWSDCISVNHSCWVVFEQIRDKDLISDAIKWGERLIESPKAKGSFWYTSFLDTYANLLYKIGRTPEAIQWEEKVVYLNPTNKKYQTVLEQMKNGEKTYNVIW